MWFHREMNSIFYVEADIKPAKIKDDRQTTVKKIEEERYKFLLCRVSSRRKPTGSRVNQSRGH